jgi:hypothetical protein
MGFIERELDRIAAALREPRSAEQYAQLYAAQQALSWALEPIGFRPPYDSIADNLPSAADCSPDVCPAAS